MNKEKLKKLGASFHRGIKNIVDRAEKRRKEEKDKVFGKMDFS